jgi:hypothetical protein
MLGDAKPIQDVQRVAGLLGDHVQIRLPHVAADEREGRRPLLPEPAEEAEQRLGAAVLANPQQPLPRRIDLIHEGQEVSAVLPVDLIDADRSNSGEIHVIPPPGDGHGHRPKHLVPAGAKEARDLLPTEALCPRREKPLVHRGELMLALGPRHLLHGDPTAGAVDAPHHVEEEHAQAPERDELEAARREPVVCRARLSAPGASRSIAAVRRDVDRQREASDLLLELHRAVDKSPMLLNPVQDSLDLHPAVRLREWLASSTAILAESTRDASLAGLRVWKLPDLWTQRTRPQVFAKPQTVSHSSHTPYSPIRFSRTKNSRTPQNHWSSPHRFCGGGRSPCVREEDGQDGAARHPGGPWPV